MYFTFSFICVSFFLYFKRIEILQWLCIQNAKYKRLQNSDKNIFKLSPLVLGDSQHYKNTDLIFPHVESVELIYGNNQKLSELQETLLKDAIKKWEIFISTDLQTSSVCLYNTIKKEWLNYINQNISLFDRITRSNKSIFPESILLFQNTLLISMTGNRQYIEGDIQNSSTICIRLRSDFDNLILLPC